MKKLSPFIILQIGIVLSMLLTSCQPVAPTKSVTEPTQAAQPAAIPTTAKTLSFGYTLHAMVPFTEEIKFGAEQAGKDLGVDVQVVGPPQLDAQGQIALFEGFISKGVDGLVTVPQAEVWVKEIDTTVAKGIPVMSANVFAVGSQSQFYVGEDGYVNGTGLGEATAKLLSDAGFTTGKAVVGVCAPGVATLTDRYNGFVDAMKKDAPGITVTEPYDAKTDIGANYTFWENIYSANPDMTVAVGLCSIDLPNLAKLKQKTGATFKAVGFDEVTETMDALKAGLVDVTIGQHPYLQGYLPILALVMQLKEGRAPVKGWLVVPTDVVTKDNVNQLYQRQTDDTFRVSWYKTFMADTYGADFSGLYSLLKPMPTK
jgi:simple sugar transport system substrate-binding protein